MKYYQIPYNSNNLNTNFFVYILGNCVIYNPHLTEPHIDYIGSCVRKTNFSGCPTESYNSNEIYLRKCHCFKEL